MISFLSSPKPFWEREAANQLRAIASWQRALPGGEIILYGRMEGDPTAKAAIACQCISDVETATGGLPYFNSIIAHARRHARFDLQVYLNCDILLTSSIARALEGVHSLAQFLLIGQRLDLAEEAVIDLSQPILNQLAKLATGKLLQVHSASGSDYFMFRRGMWTDLPPVIIGRGAYDNALIAYCLRRGIPVIDATDTVVAIHQFHGYGHVQGGKSTVFGGFEERQNRWAHDIVHGAPTMDQADLCLTSGRIRRNDHQALLQRWESHLRFKKGCKYLSYGLRLAARVGRVMGCKGAPRADLDKLLAGYPEIEYAVQNALPVSETDG